MRHAVSPRFDDLEDRKLLSKAHIAAAHPASAVAAPLVLNGTLAVDYKAATMNMNADGSSTTVVPVSGRLGTLGGVHGDWNQSVDSYGDYEGPDTIKLHDTKGSFIITFNDQNPGKTYKTAEGPPTSSIPSTSREAPTPSPGPRRADRSNSSRTPLRIRSIA